MNIYLLTFLSVFGVSLVSFVGLFTLSLKKGLIEKLTLYLVSLSAGTLLGGAFFHLLPEVVEESENSGNVWLGVIVGIMLFFILEKVICWRHCHIPTSDEHPHPLGIMNLIGDALHNLLDGVIIAGSYLIDPSLGLATTIAVLIHEIPQEIGDFGVLLHAGYSVRKALVMNFLTALTAIIGAMITLWAGVSIHAVEAYIAPLTAGGFIYIAVADLMPELKKESGIRKSLLQFLFILIGLGLMMVLKNAH